MVNGKPYICVWLWTKFGLFLQIQKMHILTAQQLFQVNNIEQIYLPNLCINIIQIFLYSQRRRVSSTMIKIKQDGICFYSALSFQLIGTQDNDIDLQNMVHRTVLLNKNLHSYTKSLNLWSMWTQLEAWNLGYSSKVVAAATIHISSTNLVYPKQDINGMSYSHILVSLTLLGSHCWNRLILNCIMKTAVVAVDSGRERGQLVKWLICVINSLACIIHILVYILYII